MERTVPSWKHCTVTQTGSILQPLHADTAASSSSNLHVLTRPCGRIQNYLSVQTLSEKISHFANTFAQDNEKHALLEREGPITRPIGPLLLLNDSLELSQRNLGAGCANPSKVSVKAHVTLEVHHETATWCFKILFPRTSRRFVPAMVRAEARSLLSWSMNTIIVSSRVYHHQQRLNFSSLSRNL